MSARIQITVRLIGAFRIDRFKEKVVDYPAGIQVAEIIDELQISRRALGTVLINGLHAGIDAQPRDADVVVLLPILGGG